VRSLLVHYHELALKGGNRAWFVDRLVRNLREACAGLDVREVRAVMGRVEVALAPEAEPAEVLRRVRRTFGVANVAVATVVPPDLAAIGEHLVASLEGLPPAPFRVRVARGDKQFPVRSPEVERLVGGRLREAYGWPLDLRHPERVVHVEILRDAAYCFTERLAGPGGLPAGSSGRVLALLSGGIDSPVAAWRMMKRGCRAHLVHFHSQPITSGASQVKALALAAVLAAYQLRSRLFIVPFADVQRTIVAVAPAALRVVLYRRFMLRIAERLARRGGARALVTGDAVGQVASQTLDNLAIVGEACRLPLLRPLVGMDKEEIVAEARRIGTYETSVLDDEDCCQVFTPRRPATGASFAAVSAAETLLPVDELVAQAVAATAREDIGPAWGE
jgi:thiamine biosynthesis protein ThiI